MTTKTTRTTPDSLDGLAPARWAPEQYHPIVGSGADKLADSAVAPLVAYARGMRTIGPADVKARIADLGFTPNSVAARQVRAAVGVEEALEMPWWRLDDVADLIRYGGAGRPSAVQLRPHPANMRVDERNGKKRKYENLHSQPSVIGIHPATPMSWLTSDTATAFIAEGMLKGDSALTAYLRSRGISDTDLLIQDDTSHDARTRLAAILDTIPPADRVLILSVFGVGNWRNNPEWYALRIGNGTVSVAFDGDVATNPNVWKQGSDLFGFIRSKKATPKVLMLPVGPTGAKVGVDDYLAEQGTWDDMLAMLHDALPPMPSSSTVAGGWRMDPDSLTTQKRVPGDPDAGEPDRWAEQYPFVASIAAIEERRAVTPVEEETGVYDSERSARDVRSVVEIDVSFKPGTGAAPVTATIHGPAAMLAATADRWLNRDLGAVVPTSVLELQGWPPTQREFNDAMKAYRKDARAYRASWTHMGWVPRPGNTPAFIVGEKAIGPTGDETGTVSCAVTEREFVGASRFGVDLPVDLAGARDDVRATLRAYLGDGTAETAVWTDPRTAAAVIAAALRPVVPLPCRIAMMLSGASGIGKTYTAATIMAFWQAYPGAWDDKRLPGGAKDTFAATEVAISQTPIWVTDDLAPSGTDPQAQRRDAKALNDTIRNVHNGTFRRRNKQDMTSMDVHPPRALFICSAEAAPWDETSIMNRLVHIEATGQFLNPSRVPTDELKALWKTDNPMSRITGYAIRMLAQRGAKGWPELVADWARRRDDHKVDALSQIREGVKNATRQAETIADIALGLELLAEVVADLGLATEYGDTVAELIDRLYSVAAEGYEQSSATNIGYKVVDQLRSLLRSHQGYVGSVTHAGPPVEIGHGLYGPIATKVNDMLGWVMPQGEESPRPGGLKVADLVTARDGSLHVLFDPSVTYAEVSRRYGMPGGHNPSSVWEALWSTGSASSAWRRKPRGGGGLTHVARVTQGGVTFEGIPIPLSTLVGDPTLAEEE